MARIACIHGLGGTGATMGRLADLLRIAGHDVVTPTLPGHGLTPDALLDVRWSDWLDAIPHDVDVVVGQSMGGSLALAAASRSTTIGAVVCVNALAPDPDAVDGLEWRRDRGTTWIEDVPTAVGEEAYDRIPIRALLEMATGIAAVDLRLVDRPVLVVHGALDDAVDPGNSDVIAATVAGPAERLTLARSGHVAVLGPEVDALAEAVCDFVERVR